ncbi:hypothetical protein DPEC_G00358680 [Dallia pectoralis]|uniref:Uncharacterized protein n=1 Tax=Dallia pectoralis TaxID=75939 RepID=A0ACC2F0J2_DALPE|nr:hypothetical protein DPEC_G00358680 [Dallia pectoralis]
MRWAGGSQVQQNQSAGDFRRQSALRASLHSTSKAGGAETEKDQSDAIINPAGQSNVALQVCQQSNDPMDLFITEPHLRIGT